MCDTTGRCLWGRGAPSFPSHRTCADTKKDLFRQILHGKVVFPADDAAWATVSPACVDFIKGLLAVDPDARMGAEGALVHPFVVTAGASLSDTHLGASLATARLSAPWRTPCSVILRVLCPCSYRGRSHLLHL